MEGDKTPSFLRECAVQLAFLSRVAARRAEVEEQALLSLPMPAPEPAQPALPPSTPPPQLLPPAEQEGGDAILLTNSSSGSATPPPPQVGAHTPSLPPPRSTLHGPSSV